MWTSLQRDYTSLQINQQTAPGATKVPAVFPSNTTLSASVWEGSEQNVIFQPTVAWNNSGAGYANGQFQVSFPAADTTELNSDGEYHILLTATDSSNVPRPAWEGLVKVIPTPGSYTPSPPDLITYDYCLGMLSAGITLTDSQIDALPGIIAAASNLFRRKCNENNFDQRTYTEWHEPTLDGYVRLSQQPIQIVKRVQGVPNLAMTIVNNSTGVQTSQAYFAYTGYDGGVGVNAKTATGIYLDWTSSGAESNASVTFASNPTIGQLATAINAVGSGWSAQATYGFSEWSCSELTGGFVGQGTSSNVLPTTGAYFRVLSNLSNAQLRPRSPMLWVGQQYGGNLDAARWGPGGEQLFDGYESNENVQGIVKVTYVGGYNTIPPDVQNAVANLAKWMLELLKQELLLKSESAGDYSYELSEAQVHAMPKPIWEAIGAWKQHYA